jgi:hypothetical protein
MRRKKHRDTERYAHSNNVFTIPKLSERSAFARIKDTILSLKTTSAVIPGEMDVHYSCRDQRHGMTMDDSFLEMMLLKM